MTEPYVLDAITPPDMLCVTCGRPYSEHDHDADVEAERARIEEFRREVAVRVEQKMAEYHAVKALVEHEMNPTVVPKPRSGRVDAEERAYIKAVAEQCAFQQRVARKIQDIKIARGDAEFVVKDGDSFVPQTLGYVPSHEERLNFFKDAPVLDTRDCVAKDI